MRDLRGFGKSTLRGIATRLGLSDQEFERLWLLRELAYSRSPRQRGIAKKKFHSSTLYSREVDLAEFETIANWYSLPILALTDIGVRRPREIARRLGLHLKVVSTAIDRLVRIGALELQDGEARSTGNFFVNRESIPSSAVRAYHRQILKKAEEAVETQSVAERNFGTLVFGFDPKRIDAVKKRMSDFMRSMESEFGKDPGATEVYALGLQYFRLTEPVQSTSNNKTGDLT